MKIFLTALALLLAGAPARAERGVMEGKATTNGSITISSNTASVHFGGSIDAQSATVSSLTVTGGSGATYSITSSSGINVQAGGIQWPDGTRSTTAVTQTSSGGSSDVIYSTTVFANDTVFGSTTTGAGASNYYNYFGTITIPTADMPTVRGQCITLTANATTSAIHTSEQMAFLIAYSSAGTFTVLASIPAFAANGTPWTLSARLKYNGGNNFSVKGIGLAGDSGNVYHVSIGGPPANGSSVPAGQSNTTPFLSIPVASGQSFIIYAYDVSQDGYQGVLSVTDAEAVVASTCR